MNARAKRYKIFGSLKTLKIQPPTEKNRAMLRRIIAMSSNEGSRIMDCFCGGGGFLQEALKLGRKFIGIDESIEAIKLNQK
ncbi:site-specific DNA-methyltransferase [Campylobacter upsaliensis]|uniref:site-specific DNA-methyltransferase n=1 Tax=Campylobacter upsaliensis TaxID=28080 RepID=UPI0021499F16|nr:site-specific DNA-methyltransferase [Campylobacter upsaliensis]MCR2107166.1 site-specific DNA-methyltransferase [Campylobacter upsaliensis]MCR2123393.1 site-specific DNA-methyltransferase [Campylobacter upsaliensis]